MQEVRAAMGHLGVPPEAIFFLGLPDGGSGKIWYDHLQSSDPYPAVPYWGELETSILNTHFCNIFDIAAEVNGPYSDDAVRKELVAAGLEARTLIAAQLKAKPAYVERLQKLRQGRK